MNQDLFLHTCNLIIHHEPLDDGIGTLSEKTVHSVLKHYLEPNTNYHEIKVDRYFADVSSPYGIIEIQTRGFDKLRRKLDIFLEHAPVTVVYPIAYTKYLRWINKESGEITSKRKSPKQGSIFQVFPELYKIKFYLRHPNFHLKLILIDVEEYRYLDGWSKDKKKGSTRCDGIPIGLFREVEINTIMDYHIFLDLVLPNNFTTKDFSKAARITQKNASVALNILHHLELIERVGKDGHAYLYKKVYKGAVAKLT